jgi:hypothetical protein
MVQIVLDVLTCIIFKLGTLGYLKFIVSVFLAYRVSSMDHRTLSSLMLFAFQWLLLDSD